MRSREQMPEYDFIHPVLLKELGKQGILPADAEGWIVDEGDEGIPLLPHLLYFRKGEAEALPLAAV